MNKLEVFASEQLKETVPSFNIADTVRVHNRIKEGTRERIQMYEGTVIARHGGGISETFTVRRVAYGCGVEKTFPIHSPNVAKVEVIRKGKVQARKALLHQRESRQGFQGQGTHLTNAKLRFLCYGTEAVFCFMQKNPAGLPDLQWFERNSAGFLYKGYSASSMFCTVRSIVF